ncbi:TlpA family protein disulfide reductase [Virgibacillus kekensis]|uniref:TlpA family protein disulfide reductase n=1 Tax=Virgibacillus kekensis TaxID=202261 RepID=A0ABV9DM59_9BACI
MLLEKMQDITLTDLHGRKVSTKDFHGKNRLIFMWASW